MDEKMFDSIAPRDTFVRKQLGIRNFDTKNIQMLTIENGSKD